MAKLDLSCPLLRRRIYDSILKTAHNAVCPEIKRPCALPLGLERWIAFDQHFEEGWFGALAPAWFASLPTRNYEPVTQYGEGASKVVERLLMPSRGAALVVSPVKRVSAPKVPFETYGYIERMIRVCLDRPDAEIIASFRRLLADARRTHRRQPQPHRPAKREVLQRDFVVYVLDRAGWDIDSIQKQLRYMKCSQMPPKSPFKNYLRKVRARFRRLEKEVASPFLERQREAQKALVENLLEGVSERTHGSRTEQTSRARPRKPELASKLVAQSGKASGTRCQSRSECASRRSGNRPKKT